MHPLTETVAAAKKKAAQIEKLEEKLRSLNADLADLESVIIEDAIKVAGPDAKGTVRAEIVTDSGTVKVTWPVASLKLTEDNFDEARKLAGGAFAKIAEKIPVTHTLVKAARDLIPALLDKAAAQKLLKLLGATPAAPRIAYS